MATGNSQERARPVETAKEEAGSSTGNDWRMKPIGQQTNSTFQAVRRVPPGDEEHPPAAGNIHRQKQKWQTAN
ncbi:UNVERIFIED_CONTAM: hypothetical protein Slati_0130200 [Sesamum latifolium]|uniref:Uncharacterized protein n=1 Tax=Sesamum latifolium TaxID=2727402 RepID=A0AAW2Y9V7_9LAMI